MSWELIAFLISAAAIAFVSRKSLLHPASHGFPRFFAWVLIASMFFLNVSSWFDDPFNWHQILSWILLLASLVPLVLGIARLSAMGGQGPAPREDASLYNFEKTTSLVTDGIYARVRHPIYASLILVAWGMFLKSPSLLEAVLAAAASLLLLATAIRDEAECIAFFGDEYREYMRHTKRFIPFLW